MTQKFIGMIKFEDGEIVTITFDTLEELDDYIEEMADYIDKVMMKARFDYGSEKPELEIIIAAAA